MSEDLAEFWVHTASVETLTGTGAYGPIFAAAQSVTGFAEQGRQLVRSSDGQEVVSESTWYGPIGDAALFKAGSRVTLPDGSTPTVILAKPHTSGELGLPDHVEVSLT